MAKRNQTSHQMASQIRAESGRPISSPSAKPRLGRSRDGLFGSIWFMMAALLTMGSDLPSLDRKGQPSRGRPSPHRALRMSDPAQWGRGGGLRAALADLRADLGGAWRLVALALSRDPARRAEAMGVILLGNARPVGGQKAAPRWAIRLAILALSFSARAALAQEDAVVIPVNLLESTDGEGVRIAGGLVLYPELAAAARYDRNIYNIDTPKRSDVVFALQPRFTLTTDFPRHRVELFGEADVRRYAANPDENSEAGNVGLRALLELGSAIDLRTTATLTRGIEQRGTAGDQFLSDRPVVFNRKELEVELSRGQHRLEVGLGAKVSRTDYADATIGGVPVSLAGRDVSSRSAFTRIAYNLGSRIQVYSRFKLDGLSYRDPASRNLNSSGYDVLAGGRIRVTRQIDLEAGAGLIHRSFDNPAFKSLNAVNFALTASWTPHPTWQVIANAARTVDPSPVFNSPAIFRTSFSLEARHLVTPKLLVGLKAAHASEDYRGIGRTDRRNGVDATALYRLTRNIGVTLDAGYRKQDGGALGRSFNGFAAGIGLKVIG